MVLRGKNIGNTFARALIAFKYPLQHLVQIGNPDQFDFRFPGQSLLIADRKDKAGKPETLRLANPHIDVTYGPNLAG